MKYVITGSLGHISKPVVEKLVEAGHDVSVISSKEENAAAIKAIGATPVIGNIEDAAFINTAFKAADVVYLMIPPKFNSTDWLKDQQTVADNYAGSVKLNNIKQVVVLSSIGAHMGTGAGPVDGLAYLEKKINELSDVNAVYLRPSYFYYNLLSMIPLIQHAGIMGSNQPADFKLALVHPTQIAAVALKWLLSPNFTEKQIEYISNDERSWEDIKTVLTKAIGKENIPWVEFTDQQSFDGMVQAGLPETIAKGYATMGTALRTGEMQSDYFNHKPAEQGKIKLEDFAKEFAAAFANS